MNQAEETNPIKSPDGSSSRAKSGRKAADKLMPISNANAAITMSKYSLGYRELAPKYSLQWFVQSSKNVYFYFSPRVFSCASSTKICIPLERILFLRGLAE